MVKLQFCQKKENIGKPLSPYVVTKYAIEVFADVFYKTYGLNYIGLRYFNIFGPRQNQNNPYAAVIPIFCDSFIKGTSPNINGDGETSRDFTYIDNDLHANDLALFSNRHESLNQVYNVACGNQISLNQVLNYLQKISGKNIHANYASEGKGDVKHSMADISKIEKLLGYKQQIDFYDGLKSVYKWYNDQSKLGKYFFLN